MIIPTNCSAALNSSLPLNQPRLRGAAVGVGNGERIGGRKLHHVNRRDDEASLASADRVARAELHSRTLLDLDVHDRGARAERH